MSDFRDKVILITGAASGIGRHLALAFSKMGAKIAALDRQQEGLERLLADLPNKQASSSQADVTDLEAVRAGVRRLESALGPTDVLIACAGIGRKTPADRFSAEDINATIQVNLIGVVNSIDAVIAGMRDRRRGHLVVLSSLASYRGLPLMSAYCASKAGVNALFDSLRIELPPFGINLTTVCPGWIKTPMTAELNLPAKEVMDVETATTVIVDAITRKKPFIAFPARIARQVRMLKYLPRGISDWLARKLLARAQALSGK